ncbi:hypothetical protein F4819DRAFT_500361 [Hypoxylon fuscum]|nr:hypothetical protein F4819DRAFT_500361 [Hypoxylon fuscum]
MISNNLGPTVVAISWVFAALSAVLVLARFYVRLRIVRRFTIDDCIVAVTLLLALGDSIFLTISSAWGLGQHMEILQSQPNHIMYTIKWVYLCEFFSILSPGFGRISFAFLLLGLMPPSKTQRRVLWAIICVQFIVDVGTIIVSFSQCRPMYGFWDDSIGADCWPPYIQEYTGYFQGSVCSLVDLILALFPTSMFWNLKMEFKQKLYLSCIMGLGIVAMIASIVKTINLRAISAADLTYDMAKLAIWWTLEAYLVLLAVTIPTLKPILKVPRSFPYNRSSPSRHANTFNSRKRDLSINGIDHDGPFERLNEYTFSADINSNNASKSIEASGHPMGQLSTMGIQKQEEDGIRKDITVSVTFGRLA